MLRSLVGSEMCIRDSGTPAPGGIWPGEHGKDVPVGADKAEGRPDVQADAFRASPEPFPGQLSEGM